MEAATAEAVTAEAVISVTESEWNVTELNWPTLLHLSR